MSVMFTAAVEPIGFKLGCAYDTTIHPSWDDAVAAHGDHPDGGCAQARAWGELEEVVSTEEFCARYAAELDRLGDHPDACVHYLTISPAYAEESPDVNVSNENASTLLATLGLVADDGAPQQYGTVDADDFLGRVLTALAVNPPDIGLPTIEDRGGCGATMIECGRPVGYIDECLAQLHTLALWSQQRDVRITWS